MNESRPALTIIHDLAESLGRRHGLLSRVYADSGEAATDADALRTEFRAVWDELASAFHRTYASAADPERALQIINPHALTDPPPAGSGTPDHLSVGVWSYGDLLVFVVGREYRLGTVGRYFIVLGVAREAKEMAARGLA